MRFPKISLVPQFYSGRLAIEARKNETYAFGLSYKVMSPRVNIDRIFKRKWLGDGRNDDMFLPIKIIDQIYTLNRLVEYISSEHLLSQLCPQITHVLHQFRTFIIPALSPNNSCPVSCLPRIKPSNEETTT